MAKRYFKATDGKITAFRASDSRVYQSANIRCMSFSGAHATPIHGTVPAVEITKSEYEALQALKVERIKCGGGNLQWASAPSNSWVSNAALETV